MVGMGGAGRMSLSCMSIGTCLCLKCVLGVAEGVGGLMEMGDTFSHSQPVLRVATSMNSPLTYPPSLQQQVQPWSPVHRLLCPGSSAPGWPGHHCLLPVSAAGPAGQADGHLTEPAAGEPAHEASQVCVLHPCGDNPHHPSPRRPHSCT